VATFVEIASSAARSRSTNTARLAPRDNASMPSAPVPAKRSSTVASTIAPRASSAENIASRTMSFVGLTRSPSGAVSLRPRALPAITRSPFGRLTT
jgi:hypothetical protein